MSRRDQRDLMAEAEAEEAAQRDLAKTLESSAQERIDEWAEDDPTNVGGGRDANQERPTGATLGGQAIQTSEGSLAAFLMLEGIDGEEHAFSMAPGQLEMGIGRTRHNEVQILTDGEVSRRHARVLRRMDTFYIEDLGSTNGTLVNGTLVESARLTGGEEITIGLTKFHFVLM